MFFHFERHDSDGNDNSIVDMVVEASTVEEAEDILIARNPDWEVDRASEVLELSRSLDGDNLYFQTFYLQGEYSALSLVKRSRYHGYDEILK